MEPITRIYPLPLAIKRKFTESEQAVLDMLENTLSPAGSHRRRTASEGELERSCERAMFPAVS